MASPAVSVILPNYNYGGFIGQTIQSILDQSYTDWEAVIVDDGSKDNSVEVIEAMVCKDPARLKLVRRPNGGLPAARNTALPHCRGRYIAFLDSDDLWHKDYLKTVVGHLEKDPSKMAVYTNAELFRSDTDKTIGSWFGPLSHRKASSGRCAADLFTRGNFIPIVTALIRREVIDEAGKFDERFRVGEDWDFWLRVTARYEMDYLPKVLCRIRRHSANLSFYPLHSFNCLRIYKKILRLHPELADRMGFDRLRRSWYHAYYEAGRSLTLQGKLRRARKFFRKALTFRGDWFSEKFWLYYPLTFMPFMTGFVKTLRVRLVRARQKINPRVY
jgi:glycosyltransferase involved in cell wall biosynthesis